MGDYEDFQVKVGLLEERITPHHGLSAVQKELLMGGL